MLHKLRRTLASSITIHEKNLLYVLREYLLNVLQCLKPSVHGHLHMLGTHFPEVETAVTNPMIADTLEDYEQLRVVHDLEKKER